MEAGLAESGNSALMWLIPRAPPRTPGESLSLDQIPRESLSLDQTPVDTAMQHYWDDG